MNVTSQKTPSSKLPSPGEEGKKTSRKGERPTITLSLPSGWARAGLAGIEAALLGWLFPMALGMIAFWGAADNQWMRNVDWSQAGRVGTAFWILSLGVPTNVGGIAVSLIPLGWTILQIALLRLLLVNLKGYSIAAVWAAPVFFVATTAVIVGSINPESNWWWALLGGLVVSVLGALWRYLATLMSSMRSRIGLFIRSSIRLGGSWGLLLFVLSLAAALSVRLSNALPGEMFAEQVGAQGADHAFLWIMELAYLPNIAIWTLAMVFSVPVHWAGDQLLSPDLVDKTIIPAVTSIAVTPSLNLWFLVIVAVAAGFVFTWSNRKMPVHLALLQVFVASFLLVAGAVLLAWLSQGALGEELLTNLGPEPWQLGLTLVIGFVAPVLVTVLLLNEQFDCAAVAAGRYLGSKVKGLAGARPNVVAKKTEEPRGESTVSQDAPTEVIALETEVVDSSEVASKVFGDADE